MHYKNKPEKCNHLNVEKEYFLGAQTGDYICTDCGLTYSDKKLFEKNKPQKNN